MTENTNKEEYATLFLGCPEVPVQMGDFAVPLVYAKKSGRLVTIAANPSVIKLARVADQERHYMDKMIDLDRCIGDIAEKKRRTDIAIIFAHNDAGITYAATVRYLHPGRLVLVLFGRHAEELVSSVDFPCEMIVEKAVHDPAGLKKKIDEVFQWPA